MRKAHRVRPPARSGMGPATHSVFAVMCRLPVMHRPAWLRSLIAIWGLWFATSVVEPAGLFACEMHGAAAGYITAPHSSGASAPSQHDPSHDASPHHAATSVVHATLALAVNAPASPAPGHHGCCTCLGHCCQSVPIGAPAPATTLAPLAEHDGAVAAIMVATSGVSRRPYSLPFANGPPTTAL
jgi:hypothetical protein